jgi:exosome complex component RRP42
MTLIKDYLVQLLKTKKREDGRGLFDYRDVKVDVNPIAKANGSARVKIGKTEVLVGVKLDVGNPFPDTPEDGILITSAELTPLASAKFEPGPPREGAIELARVIDRGIRESKAIALDKMCIAPKEKVWIVFVDVYPVNDAGNLLDAGALGAMVALKNAVFPEYDAKEEEVKHKILTKKKLPMNKVPILCTFGKLDGSLILDATDREEQCLDVRLSISTTEDGHVAAMQKGNVGTLTDKEIGTLVDAAVKKGKELRKLI